jgi:hypothetical protein
MLCLVSKPLLVVLMVTSMKMVVATYSLVDADQCFRGTYHLHHQAGVNLMMETVNYSETLVSIYKTAQ